MTSVSTMLSLKLSVGVYANQRSLILWLRNNEKGKGMETHTAGLGEVTGGRGEGEKEEMIKGEGKQSQDSSLHTVAITYITDSTN